VDRVLRTAEPIEFTTEPLQEPFASRDTSVSCLVRLSARNSGAAWIEAGCSSIDLAGETLPLSQLVRLAAELGLQAEWVRLDWQGLKTAVADHPVLIVHSNTEVVVVTAGGRSGAEEVSVWDPKHDGVVFFVSHEDFERTWSGHALLITGKDAGANIFDASPALPDMPIQQTPPRTSQRSLGFLPLGVAATVIVAIGGIVLFLLTPPGADQAAGPGATTPLDSLRAQNPLVNQRQAASKAGVVVTTPIVTTPEASLSATPPSTGAAAEPKPGATSPLGAPKREVHPATQPHL
jgi:hypothetical protein